MDIVRCATRRRETLLAQCHAPHAPLNALLPSVLGAAPVAVAATAAITATVPATACRTGLLTLSADGDRLHGLCVLLCVFVSLWLRRRVLYSAFLLAQR